MIDNLDKNIKELIIIEIKAMTHIKHHDNIIDLIEYGNDLYVKDSGEKKQVSFIILDLASGGELFDFVSNSGAFSEPIARYFFK